MGSIPTISAMDNKDWEQVSLTWREFCNKGLAVPGTLVQVKMKKEKKIFLIGDINVTGGVCDDCMAFDYDSAKVTKYKVLVKKDW